MGHCPSTLLRELSLHAPASLEALVPRAALDRFTALTDPMPALCGGGRIECDLAREGGVGFALDVLHDDAAVVRPIAAEGSALHATLDRWLCDHSLVNAMIERVVLEFDTASERDDAATTTGCSPWLGVRPRFERDGREEIASPAWLGTLCAELVGETVASGATHRVARCTAALPDGARVERVGASIEGGSEPSLRLEAVMRTASLLPWLHQIGWNGDLAAARETVQIAREAGFAHLAASIDLGAEVGDRLEVELACNDTQSLSSRWDDLLRGLIDRGLATGERAAAVRRWWGRRGCRSTGTAWRVDLQRQFKVALSQGETGELAARAALGFEPRCVLV